MSDTLATPSTDTAIRDRLRDTITKVQYEENRLDALINAQDRAHQQLRHAQSKLSDAERVLQKANSESRQNLAYSFLNSETTTIDPVAEAKTNVHTAKSELDKLAEIEAALSEERTRVETDLRNLKPKLYVIMSELVVASPEYQALLTQHKDAWRRLRTVKEAMRAISSGLHGQLPSRYLDEIPKTEPLEIRVGFPVDNNYVDAWQRAIDALEQDADAELPTTI